MNAGCSRRASRRPPATSSPSTAGPAPRSAPSPGADVDPALVYHYFGSKEGLLDAATNPPQKFLDNVAKVWTTSVDQLGAALISALLDAWADDEVAPTLRAILQTAAHEPATREKLRRIVEGSLMGVSHRASTNATG